MIENKRLDLKIAFSTVFIGKFTNNILPFKLGEISKIGILKNNGIKNISTATFLIIFERLLDTFGVFSILLLSLLFIDVNSIIPIVSKSVTLIISLIFILVIILIYSSKIKYKIGTFFNNILMEIKHSIKLKNLIPLLLCSTILFFLEGIMFYYTSKILFIHLSIWAALITAVVVNIGISVPSAPSDIGIFHLSVILILSIFGINNSDALDIAIIVHLIQFLTSILLGITATIFLKKQKNSILEIA